MLTGWRYYISKMFIIPQRYILGIMGFLAVVNAYAMRVSLSVAITEMVHNTNGDKHDPNACIIEEVQNSTVHYVSDEVYHWTSQQQGLILSSFYWGYVITHIPGGIWAERFGGKYALGLGILCTSIFTFFTPWVIYASGGNWIWLVVLRVIEGFGEGTTFPALTALLSKWVPAGERSKIGSLVYAGSQIGTVFSNSVSGALIHSTRSWASVFYFFGGVGIIWTILWTMLCYSDPDSHPFITDKEKAYLKEQITNVRKDKKKIPWRKILTNGPLWALVVAQIGHDWGFFAMVTDLPKYFKEVLRFNVKENGLLSSIPYIFMWIVSLSSGVLCDWLISNNYLKISFARKFFTSVASVGPAVFLLLASYTGCNRNLAVLMFTIGMGFMGTFYCGMKVNALDLSPNFAGTLMAIVNGIGALTGIIVPYLISAITENHTLMEWRTVFWITFGVFMVTNVIYGFLGSAEIQEFDSYVCSKTKNDEINIDEKNETKEEIKSEGHIPA